MATPHRTFQAAAEAMLDAGIIPSPDDTVRVVTREARYVTRATRQALLAYAAVSTGGRRRITALLMRDLATDHERAALRDWLSVPEVLGDDTITKQINDRAARDMDVAYLACRGYMESAPERVTRILESLAPLPTHQGRLLQRLHGTPGLERALTPTLLLDLCQSSDPATRSWAASTGALMTAPDAAHGRPPRV
jgi:hypothetical protein